METISREELKRRKILLAATVGVGGVGIAAIVYPFLASMAPSEAAKAAGAAVDFDIAGLAPGQIVTIGWRGRPVWILHRTPAMLASLERLSGVLADPLSVAPQQPPYAKNTWRSIKPAYFVATGVCTHLGCTPVFRPEPGAADIGADWPGGFYCPCHGSRFDLAGRVFKNVPAPVNLEVPPHVYRDPTHILIGADSSAA